MKLHLIVKAAAALLSLTVVAAGFSPAVPAEQEKNEAPAAVVNTLLPPKVVVVEEKNSAPAEETAPSVPETKPGVSGEEAKAIALKELQGAEVTVTELELDDGVWEVELVSGGQEYDCRIDASTGKVLSFRRDRDDRDDRDNKPVTGSAETIGAEKAKQIALEHLNISGAVVTELELDDGVYEIEIRAGRAEYDYEVHAKTGKILEAEKDD